MSQENFMRFLSATGENPAMLARYNARNLSQLLFHAKNDGFEFTAEEMAEVVGKLEASVILNKDGDPFDGTSRLWRQMWGRYHLDYLVTQVLKRHTPEELQLLLAQR
jgi:Nif11 domain